MKPKNGQRVTLLLLVAYCLDLVWKLSHWSEFKDDIAGWGVALALIVRFTFMGFLLYLYLRLRKSSQDPRAAVRTSMSSSFRTILIMHRVLLAAVVLYVLTAERFAKPSGDLPAPVALALGVMATVVVIIALGFRTKMLDVAIASLRRNPQDTQALFRWRQAHILIMVLLLSVAMFGFVLRFMGGSFWIALPFYSASVLLLLLWAPRQVVDQFDGAGSSAIGK